MLKRPKTPDLSVRQRMARYAHRRRRESSDTLLPIQDLTSLIEHIYDVILIVDVHDTLIFASAGITKLLGRLPAGVIGRSINDWLQFVHPGDRETSAQRLASVANGQVPEVKTECRLHHADGHYLWVEATMMPIHSETGQVEGIICALRDISINKEAQTALEWTQRDFTQLVDSFEGATWELDVQTGRFSRMSGTIERLLGYPRERWLNEGDFWLKTVHPDDRRWVAEFHARLIREKRALDFQYRMVAYDGRIVWLHDSVNVIVENGEAVKLRGVLIDITTTKDVENAEREYRSLVDVLQLSTAELTSTLDQDEVFDRIIDYLNRVIPFDKATVMMIDDGLASPIRMHPAPGTLPIQRWVVEDTPTLRQMRDTALPLVISDPHSDNRWVDTPTTHWIRSYIGAPIRLDSQVIGFINLNSSRPHLYNEIDALRLQVFADQAAIGIRNSMRFGEQQALLAQRNQELSLERERLTAILDASGEGIFYTEGELIRYANSALCTITGYNEGELIGMRTTRLRQADTTRSILDGLEAILPTVAEGKAWRGEIKLRRKDGSTFDAGLTVSLVGESTQPETMRAVTIVRDISQEKLLNAMRTQLISRASHELRTPLTNVITRLYLLRNQPEQLEKHLEILEEVSGRMKRLVEDLLDVTRLEQGGLVLRPRNVSLQHLVVQTVELQRPEADKKQQNIAHVAYLPDMVVTADPDRIIQVVTNLITNAINYTDPGGEIAVRVYMEKRYRDKLPNAVVEIRDTGVGISAEDLPFIFEPFFRVESTVIGSGLGLSIARDIINRHGGQITVSSRPGHGTKFKILLPLVKTRLFADADADDETEA